MAEQHAGASLNPEIGLPYTQELIVGLRVVDLRALAALRQKDSREGLFQDQEPTQIDRLKIRHIWSYINR